MRRLTAPFVVRSLRGARRPTLPRAAVTSAAAQRHRAQWHGHNYRLSLCSTRRLRCLLTQAASGWFRAQGHCRRRRCCCCCCNRHPHRRPGYHRPPLTPPPATITAIATAMPSPQSPSASCCRRTVVFYAVGRILAFLLVTPRRAVARPGAVRPSDTCHVYRESPPPLSAPPPSAATAATAAARRPETGDWPELSGRAARFRCTAIQLTSSLHGGGGWAPAGNVAVKAAAPPAEYRMR